MNDLYSALSRLVKALDPANGEVPPESECKSAFLQAKEVLEQHSNNGWQPIETAPKDENILLFQTETQGVFEGKFLDVDEGCWWNDAGFCIVDPTHWMPFPPPPETDK